ncbi:hypothetical protein BgiMline_026564 [Biomphalaria glabrata]|nr:hypothetical protein BgiMline_021033 [Biomphalaria glabrata]KAI8767604.1 hypothetical protein BgiBS90_028910 [Biomphalaria glabrata]
MYNGQTPDGRYTNIMAEDCARYQEASHIRKWPDLSLDTPSGQTTLQTHATQQRLATVALATVQQVCKGRPTNILPYSRSHNGGLVDFVPPSSSALLPNCALQYEV